MSTTGKVVDDVKEKRFSLETASNGKAKCSVRDEHISHSDGSTSAMKKHLDRRHGINYY